jgi:hypothetical protein
MIIASSHRPHLDWRGRLAGHLLCLSRGAAPPTTSRRDVLLWTAASRPVVAGARASPHGNAETRDALAGLSCDHVTAQSANVARSSRSSGRSTAIEVTFDSETVPVLSKEVLDDRSPSPRPWTGDPMQSIRARLQCLPRRKGEPPRILRRLQLLRRWSHEQVEQVFT